MRILYILISSGLVGGLDLYAGDVKAPPVEVGILVGRDGAAFGPGVVVQGNLGRLGLYGFGSMSRVNGYDNGDGVKANLSDYTVGFGLQYRLVRFGRFAFSGFGQAAYYRSRVRATYVDPDYGVVEYRSTDRDPLVTVGPEIDYRLTPGVRIVVRPGKNFGQSFAAQTAVGFSLNGGFMFDAEHLGTNIGKGVAGVFRKLGH